MTSLTTEVTNRWLVAQQLLQFLGRNAGQEGGVGNPITVEMQNSQDRAVGCRSEKLGGVPCRGQGSGLSFTVAGDACDDETGIVEYRSDRVAERIARLASLVDRAWALRRGVAGNSSGKSELNKELQQSSLIPGDIRIKLGISACRRGQMVALRPFTVASFERGWSPGGTPSASASRA